MGCRYSTQRSLSNGKSNLLNERANRNFNSNSKLNFAYRQLHNVMTISFFIFFFRFYRTQNNFGPLIHWGRVMHICVGKLTIIRSDNGLSPGRRRAIIWTNAGILLIRPLGTNFSEVLIGIQPFSFKKMYLKMYAKWRPFVSASMC